MENVPGSFGTSASFALRFGQTIFSAASLIFMCFDYDFYDFTTFCYLATVMAIVTPWSILLALTDTYSVLVKLLPQELRVLSIVFAGDFVLSFLSLGGACAVASATELLASADGKICDVCEWELDAASSALFCSMECKFRSVLGSQLDELMENSEITENSEETDEPVKKKRHRRKGSPHRAPFF
ncbi:unnamed protein product [Arabidopsis arenosa]|uniref:CASP-like protein n=1 Tax=Arabidopsis arenosa TaxID=38785 RepID=A0A8S2AEG4_ARAAE|nr:unnamed protein product [Arabidopsis arenosa]